MTPEELSHIRRIYEQALAMSGSAREAHLRQECQDEEQIRAEIDRLLEAHKNIPSWLERPVLGSAPPFATENSPSLEGRNLSGYTLIREIGRGGMGSVYLAERSDETFGRQAAIKLILPPAGSAGIIARFQQERKILASLDHPNIAKLLDAGATEEGWPYFVMEYVVGRPIDRWCDEKKLNIRQRIELFRGVIEAVHYAHQHLVVHRDLKPGNILVTNDGVVKLLDFGIAKVLSDAEAGEAPQTLTIAGMMTPEYASPEQVNGAAITTLSDVYSLGVVLYELLTGHRPYRLLSAAVHEMARVIAEVEPARPSDVVTRSERGSASDRIEITPEKVSATREGDPNRLRKRLIGDLDAIVMMTLRKEPQRRYGSVESFSEDLRRHLEQRPILAREAGAWERLMLFWERNRGGFAAGGFMVATFLAGVAAVTLLARENIQAAVRDPTIAPVPEPFWLFVQGLSAGALWVTIYFVRVSGLISPIRDFAGWVQRISGMTGGLIWALGTMGTWWIERDYGWWRSRIAGHPDPLRLLSPISFGPCLAFGTAMVWVLAIIGRRYGWKSHAIGLVLVALAKTLGERILFGDIIPALTFEPGAVPILVSGGIIIASGLIAILVRSVIARRGAKSTAVKAERL